MDGKFVEKDVTEPLNGLTVKRNHYWLCADGDPKRALFYKVDSWKSQFDAPQCNTDRRVVDAINDIPGAEIIFIPVAYVPARTT
jgi:hypothetical protein